MATSGEGWQYRADAFSLAMSITRPRPETLTFGAALPSVGGRIEGTSGSTKHDIASFVESVWRLEGTQESERFHVTAASAEIIGLRILDRLEVRRLSAEAIGTYDAERRDGKYAQVLAQRFEVDSLMIGGRLVSTELSPWNMLAPREIGALGMLAATNHTRRIDVDNFGTVYYHHVRFDGHEAELTALRVELGSPVGGIIIAGSVRVDGNWYP